MNDNKQYPNIVSSLTASKINEVIIPMQTSTQFIEGVEKAAQKFISSLNDTALKAFNGRLERGLEMAKNGAVTLAADNNHPRRYFVHSAGSNKVYTIDLDAKTCDCPDSQKGNTCKHRVAAYYFEQATIRKMPVNLQKQPGPDSTSTPSSKDQRKPAPSTGRNLEELLAALGFDDPNEPKPHVTRETGYQLGSLYRRYLHGSDLMGQVFTVTIQSITKEKVMPHPSLPAEEKWCLTVTGLPNNLPNKILFGANGEADLVSVFGEVAISEIIGKQVIIHPKAINFAGQQRISIRFGREK